MPSSKTIIIICGPTAVGKTALAIQLAGHFRTQIISADSRQCFREINIGVAKPSAAQLAAVPHHFINSHSIHDEMNAAIFEQYALHKAADIFLQHNIAVMVGGTGLYLKAFVEGLDELPGIKPGIRQQIITAYQENGIAYLQHRLQELDPGFWQSAEQHNPHRLIRALEIIESTGRSVTTFRKGNKVHRPFNIIKIGLDLPRELLYHNINTRVDEMIAVGLLAEVEGLKQYKHINALQTVGYRELFEQMDGATDLPTAVYKIKTNTRHYAKRQLTWFKKDADITWYQPHHFSLEAFLQQHLPLLTIAE